MIEYTVVVGKCTVLAGTSDTVKSAAAVFDFADARLIVTEQKGSRVRHFGGPASALRGLVMFGRCSLSAPALLRQRRFEYEAIGR